MARVMRDEWGEMLITGWNKAGWMAQPGRMGDRIGRLIGAEPGHVIAGRHAEPQGLSGVGRRAGRCRPGRRVILSDSGNFPSDLYMAEGLIRSLGQGHELRVVAPDEVADALSEEVAVLMLTEVDYRSARRHDMKALTARAQEAGALTVWDLAHSAGAIEVNLAGAGADFAVGCTYKYLNGGPGAPAFIYVAPRHAGDTSPALSGWLGHDEPFAFEPQLPARQGDRADAGGHAAGAGHGGAGGGSGCLGPGPHGGMWQRQAPGLSGAFIAAVEAACPAPDTGQPTRPGAARQPCQLWF